MKIFIICSVRGASKEYQEKLESYVAELEADGHTVHLPHRDTNQQAKGVEICTQNMNAIKAAHEVHIFYSSKSQGTHFDMGVSFALNKRIVIVESEPLNEGKSYQRMLQEWSEANTTTSIPTNKELIQDAVSLAHGGRNYIVETTDFVEGAYHLLKSLGKKKLLEFVSVGDARKLHDILEEEANENFRIKNLKTT